MPQHPQPGAAKSGWEITEARVLDPGRTSVEPEGTLTTGYTIEARARSMAGERLPDGVFRVVVSAFLPKSDMPGQRAGVWHVNGQWTITDGRASDAEKAARHSVARLKGRIATDLVFNPAAEDGRFSAVVRLPTSPVAGRLVRGGGVFSGNSRFEGSLVLDERAGPAIEQFDKERKMIGLMRRLVRGAGLKALGVGAVALGLVTSVLADVPTRVGVRGMVPHAGTQQQELSQHHLPGTV